MGRAGTGRDTTAVRSASVSPATATPGGRGLLQELEPSQESEAPEVSGSGSPPGVILSPAFAIAHRNQFRASLKRTAFIGSISLLNGAVAFIALGLARLLVDDMPVVGPYFWLSVATSLTVVAMTLLSRPDRQRSAGGFLEEWIEAGRESLAVGLVLVFVAFFWRPGPLHNFPFSRGTVLATVPVTFLLIGAVRTLERSVLLHLRQRGHNLASVVVIGHSPSATSFIRTIHAESGTGYRVVAHIPEISSSDDVTRILSDIGATVPIDEVVIASYDLTTPEIQAIATHPSLRGMRIRAIPELFGLPPSKVQMISFADFPLLTLFENPVRGARWRVKRAFDLSVAVGTLLVASPVLAAIALAIRLTSEGPVLFRQNRIGMDGKEIQVFKFRTMYTNAGDAAHKEFMKQMLTGPDGATPSAKGYYKLTNDPRVTRVGRFLRRYSLDELPQFLNVLRGEMSIVGPRPALRYEVELYEEWQHRRFDVLPGMTGLWQVSGRSRLSPADMLRLDVHYAETWSLPKDFLIMLRTIPAVLRSDAL